MLRLPFFYKFLIKLLKKRYRYDIIHSLIGEFIGE